MEGNILVKGFALGEKAGDYAIGLEIRKTFSMKLLMPLELQAEGSSWAEQEVPGVSVRALVI